MIHPIESDVLPIECPGCGKVDKVKLSVRVITFWNSNMRFSVICDRCNWRGPERKTADDGVRAWNDRYDY